MPYAVLQMFDGHNVVLWVHGEEMEGRMITNINGEVVELHDYREDIPVRWIARTAISAIAALS